jgi:hypothetical protein
MVPSVAQTERALIRTIAGSSRKLDEDLTLSPLQAIDRLLKLADRFRDQWIPPAPWLVLEDGYPLPATMPVADMLTEIERHGAPIGIVGAALLKLSKRYSILKMMFRKDERTRKTIEVSAQAALEDLNRRIRAVFTAEVYTDPDADTLSMYYSFHPENRPTPGAKKVGTFAYLSDGQIRSEYDRKNKEHAEIMDGEAKQRFQRTVRKLQEIQAEAQ